MRNTKNKVFVPVFLAMTLLMAGCSLPDEAKDMLPDELQQMLGVGTTTTEEPVEENVVPSVGDSVVIKSDKYCYALLSEAEKIWYRDIYAILDGMLLEESLSGEALAEVGESGIDKIYMCVLNDHPELFFVQGYTYTKYTLGEELTRIDFSGSYTVTEAEREQRQLLIDEKTMDILEGLPTGSSDYEKVKYVYDWIIENTEYNLDAPDNQNICSVLLNGESVCQGYSKTMQYLLQKMDVETLLVAGSVYTGELHAWNMVKLDGEFYHVDSTWGDASYRKDESSYSGGPAINYAYLCVPSDILLRTHTIDNAVPVPDATSEACNYFVMKNAYFDSYDEEAIGDYFAQEQANGEAYITFRCSDADIYSKYVNFLIEEEKIFEVLEVKKGGRVGFVQDDDSFIMTFWLVNK